MATKTKSTKTTSTSGVSTAALAYARKLAKDGYGNCTIIRGVTQRFSKMPRKDVLSIAKALRINPGTASRQFQEVRSGAVEVTF